MGSIRSLDAETATLYARGYYYCWTVYDETDPCAYNLDWGDRLGSDYGGPNSDTGVPAGETGRPWHNGVDVQGDPGDPIRSVMTGTVERAGDDGGDCGVSVRVRHVDGSSATYCHMTGVGDGIGDGVVVGASDILGFVGDTGSAPSSAIRFARRCSGTMGVESSARAGLRGERLWFSSTMPATFASKPT